MKQQSPILIVVKRLYASVAQDLNIMTLYGVHSIVSSSRRSVIERLRRMAPWMLVAWVLYWSGAALVPIADILEAAAPRSQDPVTASQPYDRGTESPGSRMWSDHADADTIALADTNASPATLAQPSFCASGFTIPVPTYVTLAGTSEFPTIHPPSLLLVFQRFLL